VESPLPELDSYPSLIARLLARRGMRDAVQARAFFSNEAPAQPDPFLLPDMHPAVERLQHALAGHERIAVYGDFDVDGITATVILSEGLRALGADVLSFIPNRFSDGYGVTTDALERLVANGVQLVVTVDCGISALAEAERARVLGLDMIVVDHHEVGPTLPAAAAVIDPKREGSLYPTRDLCSGALSLRLLQALYSAAGKTLDKDRYLDLAALATVCDMVPLQGENRDLVREGLPVVARTRRPGLRALLRAGGSADELPDAETLGFRVGPRLNAAGRLDDAGVALELLMTNDEGRATELAERLGDLNRKRQQMVEDALEIAHELVSREPAHAPLLVVGDARISRGIVGLIASRLVESYGRPAFVYEEGPEGCVGSARAAGGFDVVLALNRAGALLTRHGGHRAAGGFALPLDHLAAFRDCLWNAAADQFGGRQPEETIDVDTEEPLRALDRPALAFLERFAPCGMGNPAPLLMSPGVTVVSRRAVGNGKHLMLDLRDGRQTWRAFAFGRGTDAGAVSARIDIVYSVEKGSRGYGPRLRLLDWHESTVTGVRP
jgi:single-stranded-DNA-specific exonuclease